MEIHIYSLFPELFDYILAVPLLLRVVLGGYLLYLGYSTLAHTPTQTLPLLAQQKRLGLIRTIGATELLIGVCLTLGIFTQAAAIGAAILSSAATAYQSEYPASLDQSTVFYIFSFAIAMSILVLGPGVYSIDLPL